MDGGAGDMAKQHLRQVIETLVGLYQTTTTLVKLDT